MKPRSLQARAKDFEYVSDGDARAPGSSHPNGLLWDFGGNSIQTCDKLMAVRQEAPAGFSIDVLPDGVLARSWKRAAVAPARQYNHTFWCQV